MPSGKDKGKKDTKGDTSEEEGDTSEEEGDTSEEDAAPSKKNLKKSSKKDTKGDTSEEDAATSKKGTPENKSPMESKAGDLANSATPLDPKLCALLEHKCVLVEWKCLLGFLETCLKPGRLRQFVFVVTENKLEHLLFQLLVQLSKYPENDADEIDFAKPGHPPADGALTGYAWEYMLRTCGVKDFHSLVMYKPIYYDQVKTNKPITVFFWCPVAESIVGEDIMSATPNAHAIQNFQTILAEHPKLKDRLISVRNLNPSLCEGLWSDSLDDKRPEVYMQQIDRACADMDLYMARYKEDNKKENKKVPLGNTSYLIMCGNKIIRDPQGNQVTIEDFVSNYLTLFKFANFLQKPQVVIGGHPTYYRNDQTPIMPS